MPKDNDIGKTLLMTAPRQNDRDTYSSEKREREALLRLSRAINATLDIDEVLRRLINELVQLLAAQSASVILYDEATAEAEIVTSYEADATFHRLRYPLTGSLAGWVAEHKRPLRVFRITPEEWPTSWRLGEQCGAPPAQVSVLLAPLWVQGKIVGCLEMVWEPHHTITDNEEHLLEMVAGQTALVITNAKLYQEKERALREAQENEQRFQRLAQATSDALWDWDLVANTMWWSDGMQKLFGYAADEVESGSSWWCEHIHPEDRERVVANIHALLDSGEQLWSDEYRYRRVDGSYAYVFDRGYVLRDDTGNPLRAFGGMVDMTARRRTEEALEESEARYRNLFENASDGIVCFTVDGIVSDVNQALLRMLGYSREEVIGRSYRQFHTPASLAAEEERIHRIQTKEKVVPIAEMELVCRDGSVLPAEIHTRLIRDQQGNPLGVLGILRDLTERKRVEEALRRSEKFNASLIDQSPLGIIVYAPDGHAVSVNRAWEHMWGVSWEQVKDYNLFTDPQLVGTPMHETLERLVKQGGETPVFELEYDTGTLTSGGNKHWTFCRFYTVQEENGEVMQLVCLNEDITARKQMEAELRRAKDAAEAASRAKSEFLANMSHEIRTPMNGIIGMTDLALDTDLTLEQREYLGMVKTSADSLLTILNDILDFSKIEAGKLTLDPLAFPLRDSVGEVLRTLAIRAHQKGLELSWRVAPEVPDLVVGDVGRLRQIMINLVGNALKFTEQGEVVVEVSIDRQTKNTVCLRFVVRDTGIGIPAEKQQLIFDPFAQADGSMTRKYGGTGLGLAISSQLVTLMGGQLGVESEMGRGSTFHFTAQFGVQQESVGLSTLATPAILQGAPVLVVDDNAANRGFLTELLTSWRMQPTTADSGHAALAILQQAAGSGQPLPLMLLDAHMPGIDGFTLAQQIKQNPALKDTTIIMLTASGQPGDIARCQALGIPLHLGKPIKQTELWNAILIALGAPSPLTPSPLAPRQCLPAQRPIAFSEDGGQLSILLVEDNTVNQKLAVRLLEKWGHQVIVAGNGKEALSVLERQRFDLVLMDVQMPEMDGLEATATIRSRERSTNSHLPIIAMTAHAMKGDRERCLAAGMDSYLTKPLQIKELHAVIQNAILKTRHDTALFDNLPNLQPPHSCDEAENEKIL